MPKTRFVVFCLLILPFFGCQKKEKPLGIHQVRFGSIDRNPSGNNINRGFRFHHFLTIDLNTDSFLLKKNQLSIDVYQKGKLPPKYFIGKIPLTLKQDLDYFETYVLNRKSGSKLNDFEEHPVLYSGPTTYLEYKKDTATRYFYIDHISSSRHKEHLLSNLSEVLFDFTNNPDSLNSSKTHLNLNDDSLISPIVNRKDFIDHAPPPPVQKTIKFTPPVSKKKR